MLDPAMASDGETFRPARQMFEGLVSTKPGTTDTEPLAGHQVGDVQGRPQLYVHAA